MDKFVTSTIIPDFNIIPGRAELARNIWNSIKNTRGGTICLYGAPGCGKSFILKQLFADQYNEYDYTKSIEKNNSHTHTVIDCPTSDILEFLKVNGSITRGTTIIVCDNIKKINFCNCIEVPTFSPDQMNQLFPGYTQEVEMSRGNMWNFEFYKQFKDKKDIFRTSKDYVKEIMSVHQQTYLTSSLEEHGHTMGMIHENYPDTQNITMNECVDIIDSMSLSDVYDTLIYTVDWDYCKYFQVEGIARPASVIDGRHHLDIKPGSCWTKTNNQKMRMSKLRHFRNVPTENLIVILNNLMKYGPSMNFYKITPQDVDVINHLKINKKFKPSEISRLKKSLYAYHATSTTI